MESECEESLQKSKEEEEVEKKERKMKYSIFP